MTINGEKSAATVSAVGAAQRDGSKANTKRRINKPRHARTRINQWEPWASSLMVDNCHVGGPPQFLCRFLMRRVTIGAEIIR
jgi:hypothetical protein